MTLEEHSFENIKYKYSLQAKKWVFSVPSLNFTFLTKCPKRLETANKIARILAGAEKRGRMDNLARENINKLVGV